jgi:hypothetical protein
MQRWLLLLLRCLVALLLVGAFAIGLLKLSSPPRKVDPLMTLAKLRSEILDRHRLLIALQPVLPTAASRLGTTPIYYVNMQHSVARRRQLEASAAHLGLQHNLRRVESPNILAYLPPGTNPAENLVFNRSLQICLPQRFSVVHGLQSRPAQHLPSSSQDTAEVCITIPPAFSNSSLPTETGCLVGHLLAMRQALLQGQEEYVLVAEDDVIFDMMPTWPQSLAEIVAGAPADWEILNLGGEIYTEVPYPLYRQHQSTRVPGYDPAMRYYAFYTGAH